MNSRKLTALSTLVSGAAAAALLAGAFTTTSPTPAYASQLAAIGGTANSGVQIQNLSAGVAQIQMQLYPQSGAAPVTLSRPNTPAQSSADFYLPSESSVPAGAYGVVLSADQPIAAIARTEWVQTGRQAAAAYGTVPPATDVLLPSVLGNFVGQNSQFSIQNAGDTAATVNVQIFREGNATPVDQAQYSITPGTSRTLTLGQGDFTGLPNTQTSPTGFVGYARVTSTNSQPLVAQSFVDFTNSNTAVYAYSGVDATSGATELFAPLVRRDYFGTSGMQLVNPGDQAANVTITYYTDPNSPRKLTGTGQTATEALQIPARSSRGVYQGVRTGNPLPDDSNIANNNGYFGSARVVSSVPIVGIVNDAVIDTSFNTRTSAAYNMATPTTSGTTVYAPLVRNNHTSRRLTTGITIQNTGSATTNATITFRSTSGSVLGSVPVNGIAAGASVSVFQAASGTPVTSGTFGSAVITSSGQPLAVIVNDASFTNPLTLDASIYNGLK